MLLARDIEATKTKATLKMYISTYHHRCEYEFLVICTPSCRDKEIMHTAVFVFSMNIVYSLNTVHVYVVSVLVSPIDVSGTSASPVSPV